ncbi:MAG: GLUG motif-containing protein, partial [Planctomycetota bacterium]
MVAETIKKAVLAVVISLFISSSAWAAYGGGSGTAEDPYLINTAAQMNTIGLNQGDWDKHFKLVADINMSAYTGEQYNVIGTFPDDPFTGVFDGNGHTISNFSYVTSLRRTAAGIFGYAEAAAIMDLTLLDPYVDMEESLFVGPLVGWLAGGLITNCCVEGGSVSAKMSPGGLLGCNSDGELTMSNCHATCSVSGGSSPGGLMGLNWWGTITNCYASGDVVGRAGVGGLIGTAEGTTSGTLTIISSCYSTGNVTMYKAASAGGLVGDNEAIIRNCYSTGHVSATDELALLGGLVQYNPSGRGTVLASFWDVQTSGQGTSAGGTGKT